MASTSTVRRALAVVGAFAVAATLTLANPAPAAAWSGWTEVPGNGFTSSAPAAVQGGNYIFVRGTDDRIYLNRRTGSSSWTGWGELPGDGRAWSGPAAVLTGNAYYVFVRGTDSHVYFNFYSGSSWSGWRLVPNDWTVSDGMTYSAPAALYNSFANRVEVFIRGTDNRIHTSFG